MNNKLLKQAQGVLMAKEKRVDPKKTRIYFTTNHTLLDLAVGGGEAIGFGMGYPSGTICRDSGGSSSTKSFKAVELIAANKHKYKDKFRWRYCDPEHGCTIDSQALYGVDVFAPEALPPTEIQTVEEWEWDVNKFLDSLKDDECGIYVLDSLDSISSQDMEDRKEKRHTAYDKGKEFDDGTYGMSQAKFLSQEMFRGLSAKLEEKNALLYVISQERDNVNAGMYGKKNRVGGGRAIGFYETVRLYSKLKEKNEAKGRSTGVLIGVAPEKVRHPRPFRDVLVTIHFTYGIDSVADEVDFLFDCRSADTGALLKRSDSLTWDDSEVMTRAEMIQYIHDNKLRKELKKRVIEKWEEIEDSIAIKLPNKFEEE
jgi:RecA/RadA recombinase